MSKAGEGRSSWRGRRGTLRRVQGDFRHFRAQYHSHRSVPLALLAFLLEPTTPAAVLMRFAAESNWPVARLARRRLQVSYASDVARGAIFGEGLLLGHASGIVIAGSVVLRKRVTVFHHVTLGFHREGWPTLEDDVRVMPGAVVVGPITVGNGAVIGANCFVNADVPAGAVIPGGTRWTRSSVDRWTSGHAQQREPRST
jgi:serine O-acetyltransferase